MGARPTRLLSCALAAAAMALLAAPAARADSVQDVFQEYQSTGQINACKHSAGALGVGVGNDLEQYATDFVDALRGAQLARGRCGGSSAGSSGGGTASNDSDTSAAGAAGSSKGPPRPKPGRAGTTIPSLGEGDSAAAVAPLPISLKPGAGGGTPGPIVVLGILAGLLLLGGVPALIGRYLGYGFSWLAPVGHVFSEAALRMSSAGGGLVDWLRMDALRRTA